MSHALKILIGGFMICHAMSGLYTGFRYGRINLTWMIKGELGFSSVRFYISMILASFYLGGGIVMLISGLEITD